MIEINIKSQSELDFAFVLIAKQGQGDYYTLNIKTSASTTIRIKNQPPNSKVVAYDSSHVVAYGSSHVVAYGSSHVVASGSSHVEASGSSHVEASDSSHVEASDSSHVEAYGSSHVEASDSSHVEAFMYAIVRKSSIDATVSIAGSATLVDSTIKKQFDDAADWLQWNGAQPNKDGKVIMYKAVSPDFYDFHTHTINYEVGKIIQAPDWQDPYPRECGCALHCSPTITATHRFIPTNTEHVHLKCEVDVVDIRVLPDLDMPEKCRVKKLVVLATIDHD